MIHSSIHASSIFAWRNKSIFWKYFSNEIFDYIKEFSVSQGDFELQNILFGKLT